MFLKGQNFSIQKCFSDYLCLETTYKDMYIHTTFLDLFDFWISRTFWRVRATVKKCRKFKIIEFDRYVGISSDELSLSLVIFGLKIHFWSFSQTVCLCLRLCIVRERIYLEFDIATMISIFSKLNAFKSGSNQVVLLLDSLHWHVRHTEIWLVTRIRCHVIMSPRIFKELDRVHV